MNDGAGSVSAQVGARLREAFPDHLVVDFEPGLDIGRLVTPDARVVVAGGDGTVGFVLRQLIDSRHVVGLLPLGTFNNFARSLHIPQDLEAAIELVHHGLPRRLTLGRINGHPFLEVAALGWFGEVIALGEAAKELSFGDLGERFRLLTAARPFRYRLAGDLDGNGSALSLVFSNTPTTGAGLEVGETTPEQPYLDLALRVGLTRADVLTRLVRALLPGSRLWTGPDLHLRFRTLRVRTRPTVPVYADSAQVGTTPVRVEADVGAVLVIVPRLSPRGGAGPQEAAGGPALPGRRPGEGSAPSPKGRPGQQ